MESLLERIQENRLDALYLFINETLRNRENFDLFFQHLLRVLPSNWSIQRVEVGHEFLSMISEPESQKQLYDLVCKLDGIKTLIFSDGYVQRKDHGSINTDALLKALPRAQNLTTLDIQRLALDEEQVDDLADAFETMQESLEEVRFTGIYLKDKTSNLDPVISACIEMDNLKSLALGMSFQHAEEQERRFLTDSCLRELCCNEKSTTLQDLTLRVMHLDDQQCTTIAGALETNSFLTSLDIRQNGEITAEGYNNVLGALERNWDLWCSVMVDDEMFQGKFNALIELNQAGRGDLLRNPTLSKLTNFLDYLKDDASALWFFFSIHDSVRNLMADYLLWKMRLERRREEGKPKDDDSEQEEPDTKRPRTS